MDTSKWTNVHIVGSPAGEERQVYRELFDEIMAVSSPNLVKDMKISI